MPNDDKSIDAMPTKAFFVNMLVRDISLERAVLDLLTTVSMERRA